MALGIVVPLFFIALVLSPVLICIWLVWALFKAIFF